jgi:hypothetical protein
MKADLTRMIMNWEQSGQRRAQFDSYLTDEDEPVIDDSPSFGCLAGRSARAMDQRESFLDSRSSYLLIYWEVADKHQLLSVALQRLSDSVLAVDASSAPATVVMRRPMRSRSSTPMNDEATTLLGDLGKSVSQYDANCNVRMLHASIQELAASKREFGATLSRSKDPSEQLYYMQQLAAMTNEIEELEAQKRKYACIAEKYDSMITSSDSFHYLSSAVLALVVDESNPSFRSNHAIKHAAKRRSRIHGEDDASHSWSSHRYVHHRALARWAAECLLLWNQSIPHLQQPYYAYCPGWC